MDWGGGGGIPTVVGRLNAAAAASKAAIVNFPLAWAFVLSFALAADKLL